MFLFQVGRTKSYIRNGEIDTNFAQSRLLFSVVKVP